jgi:hypothetical protein
MNYKLLLKHYEDHGRKYSRAERMWFADQPSFESAIRTAARAIDSRGKRYRHQTRIRREAINRAMPALLRSQRRLAACKTFDELLDTVTKSLRGIKWLGALYYYDAATRLGAYLRIMPDTIHLHAGAREGAKALKLNYRLPFLKVKDVPRPLRVLKPHQIEDFLCIYKDKVIRQVCGR